jgi:hypothetical protein
LSNTYDDLWDTPWQPFEAQMPWTIEPDADTSRAYVYALFRDAAGNVSRGATSDSIRYDPAFAPALVVPSDTEK